MSYHILLAFYYYLWPRLCSHTTQRLNKIIVPCVSLAVGYRGSCEMLPIPHIPHLIGLLASIDSFVSVLSLDKSLDN